MKQEYEVKKKNNEDLKSTIDMSTNERYIQNSEEHDQIKQYYEILQKTSSLYENQYIKLCHYAFKFQDLQKISQKAKQKLIKPYQMKDKNTQKDASSIGVDNLKIKQKIQVMKIRREIQVLTQGYCSLFEAIDDKDQVLMEEQLKQIREVLHYADKKMQKKRKEKEEQKAQKEQQKKDEESDYQKLSSHDFKKEQKEGKNIKTLMYRVMQYKSKYERSQIQKKLGREIKSEVNKRSREPVRVEKLSLISRLLKRQKPKTQLERQQLKNKTNLYNFSSIFHAASN